MTVAIGSPKVTATVHEEGGIIWAPRFTLPSGRVVAPLAECAWADQGPPGNLPYMDRLGGSFVAAPFGGRSTKELDHAWGDAEGENPLHGVTATCRWHVSGLHPGGVTLSLTAAHGDATLSFEQRITCGLDVPEVVVEVSMIADRDLTLPFGFHPILRLPERQRALDVDVLFATGCTTPVSSGIALTAPFRTFDDLSQVPGHAGPVDLSVLPVGINGDALLLLVGMGDRARFEYRDEGFAIVLTWSVTELPNCLLWYHDSPLALGPNGEPFRGLGVEPSAAAFDLATAVSVKPNPLHVLGARTAIKLIEGVPKRVWLKLAVEEVER